MYRPRCLRIVHSVLDTLAGSPFSIRVQYLVTFIEIREYCDLVYKSVDILFLKIVLDRRRYQSAVIIKIGSILY